MLNIQANTAQSEFSSLLVETDMQIRKCFSKW